MLDTLLNNPFVFIIWLLSLVIAITVHEFSHALAADRLGDPTPRIQGRLTLNPLAHLDPLGTILLLLVRFGWGKPVQFDPYNLENPRRDAAIISFAGPLSNFLLAILSAIIVRFIFPQSEVLFALLTPFIYMNILLAIFNLLPVHPLDGGKIIVGLLPDRQADEVDSILKQYGTFILLFLILPLYNGHSLATTIITPSVNLIFNFLLPNLGII